MPISKAIRMTDQRASVYDSLPDAVLRLYAGSLQPLNSKARLMFGLAEDEPVIALSDALAEGHGLQEWLFASGECHRELMHGRRGDGACFPIDLSARREAYGDAAICVLRELVPEPGLEAAPPEPADATYEVKRASEPRSAHGSNLPVG